MAGNAAPHRRSVCCLFRAGQRSRRGADAGEEPRLLTVAVDAFAGLTGKDAGG